MFEITAVSSPGAARFPNEPMWSVDLGALTRYDEDLIKPAILFADRIDLRSDRLDMLAMVKSEIMRTRVMPIRAFSTYLGLSYRRDEAEMRLLGISPDALAPREEVERFFGDDDRSRYGDILSFWKSHESQITEVLLALGEVLHARYNDLRSPALEELEKAGLLVTSGWSAGDDDPWSLVWTDEDEFFLRIIEDLLASVDSWGGAVLLEPGSRMFLDGATPAPKPSVSAPENLAVGLIARLPGVREVPIGDLVEIRNDLRDYLAPFRAEVMSISSELASRSGQLKADVAIVEDAWHSRVNPVLRDLDAQVKRGGYPRQLLNAFAEDTGSLAATGASVLLATGSIYAGVGALLPAFAAASVPFVRALNARIKEQESIHDHRLYFLYDAARRIGRA